MHVSGSGPLQGLLEGCRHIFKEDGVKGFYRGGWLVLCWAWAAFGPSKLTRGSACRCCLGQAHSHPNNFVGYRRCDA